MLKIIIFCFTLFLQYSEAHIRLTFPVGRKFGLDFLDNQRTYGPCGMPTGNTKTRLIAGKSYTFFWHMGLLHQGSYQIELFNKTGKTLEFVNFDETKAAPIITQSQLITIPQNLTCVNCTIRILRDAKEFSVPGNPYIFWSCADVDIISSRLPSKDQCSRNGSPSLESCLCDEGYTGKYCELSTECLNDTHCGGHGSGKCVKLSQIDEYPVAQCFCEFPYFGEKCSNRVNCEVATLQEFQTEIHSSLKKYRKLDLLQDKVTLYYGMLKNVTGTEPQIEFVLKSKSTSYLGLGWRPLDLTKECKGFWPKVGESVRKERGIEEVFQAEVNASGYHRISGHWSQTSDQILKTHEIEQVKFSAMDCTDIVLSSVIGNHSRIRDYYTMDRSTPQLDSFWGGEDSILFATGWESDSETTVIFRKAISAKEPLDHNLSGVLHLIWSRGQAFSSNTDPIYNRFYPQDEIKYHGYGSNQRGVRTILFS